MTYFKYPPANTVTTGTLDMTNGADYMDVDIPDGYSSVTVSALGSGSGGGNNGSIYFTVSADGTNFDILGSPPNTIIGNLLNGNCAVVAGYTNAVMVSVAGYKKLRIAVADTNTGTGAITAVCSISPGVTQAIAGQQSDVPLIGNLTQIKGSPVAIGASGYPLVSIGGVGSYQARVDRYTFSLATANPYLWVQDTFTSTVTGTETYVDLAGYKYFSLVVVQTGTVTSWTVTLEISVDFGGSWSTLLTHTKVGQGDGVAIANTTPFPSTAFRMKCTAITLGGGTNVVATVMAMN